jgi:diguanylate cyclase (GGDEF)-like protein
MIELDNKTVHVFALLILSGIVLARLFVMRFSKTYPGFGIWIVASVVHILAIAIGAIGVNGEIDGLRKLAVIMLPLIPALHLAGFIEFLAPQQTRLRKANLFTALAVLGTLSAATIVGADVNTLFIIASAGQVMMFLEGCLLFAWAIRRTRLTILWIVMACSFCALLTGVIRLSTGLIDLSIPIVSLMPFGNTWALTISMALSVILAIAQIALNAQRVSIELTEAAEQLKTLASTDALTGLLNRRSFMERASALLDFVRRHQRPVTLLMCDLDHFKQVNDRYGHPIGDRVLAVVGKTLHDLCRGSDFCGRLGGEEFGLMLAETNATAGTIVADRVRQAIASLPAFQDGPAAMTVSIGLSSYSLDQDSLDALITRADQALYRAKSQGRNRWIAA